MCTGRDDGGSVDVVSDRSETRDPLLVTTPPRRSPSLSDLVVVIIVLILLPVVTVVVVEGDPLFVSVTELFLETPA